jgi:hypothetical protein
MEELRHSSLISAEDKARLAEAAAVLKKLELLHPDDVLFDSNDQYFVSFEMAGEALLALSTGLIVNIVPPRPQPPQPSKPQ